MGREPSAVVALGSNLAGGRIDIREVLEAAITALPDLGLKVVKRSRWWRSSSWPDASLPDYLNGVALIETDLAPAGVLAALLILEARFGRARGDANASRILDLDLIAHGPLVISQPGLVLPHPRAHQRRFVMGPLSEIWPGWVHPVLGLTAETLALDATVGRDAAPMPA